MDKRYGVVIAFKKGVTKEQALRALVDIDEKIDIIDWDNGSNLNEYNAEWGGPVWYIP